MKDYPIIPGRGLVTRDATEQRLAWLREQGYDLHAIPDAGLQTDQIRHNIESYIGTVEIPLGLAGPLLFRDNGREELVYAAAGTLEGALLASMNRGAKAVSLGGGFSAAFLHQKMIRSPMFIFRDLAECLQFKGWVERHFTAIREVAERWSNHARLQTILPFVAGRSVQLKFVYTTGDASGQNMTTTCTWHAVLWLQSGFTADTGVAPQHFVIEGNGASDKKVSHFTLQHGRGVHVIAECELPERVIESILRTTSADLLRCLAQSRTMASLDGMIGYNINVANAIAAIFIATGQDLASVHESGTGILHLEPSEQGLYVSLQLPNLVIGTVGGGTHLPKQQEALRLMECAGAGKLQRFAQLIAGFALSLELSTFAAIVGGQFAKAHEKLGRNKPVSWLTKAEIDQAFVQSCLAGESGSPEVLAVRFPEGKIVENGIIINLTSRVNKKLTGFVLLETDLRDRTGGGAACTKTMLLKSKPLDLEVIKGLHGMAAAVDPSLADLIYQFQDVLEYKNCHIKELALYEFLHRKGLGCTPEFYGLKTDLAREIYVLLLELLDYDQLQVFNSENEPGKWQPEYIREAIRTISLAHRLFSTASPGEIPVEIRPFTPWDALPLYHRLAEIVAAEFRDTPWSAAAERLRKLADTLETEHGTVSIPQTIVHNDFNPRNTALRKDGRICIYDWELAVLDFPQRDIVEFLSFVLPDRFSAGELEDFLRYHYALAGKGYSWDEWVQACTYSTKAYLVTRVSFYLTGKIVTAFEFAERIFRNTIRMLDILESWKK